MQLLNSLQTQPQTAPDLVQTSLQDIINKLQIESHVCIRHPDYKPLELPSEAVARFQKLPSDLQNKYLNVQLRNFLYGTYYNGSLKRILASDTDTDDTNLALNQNLEENNTFLGVDIAFYDRLHKSNTGEGYFSPGWIVVKEETDGAIAVQHGGLTLHIERDRHLPPENQTVNIGDVVAIKMPKNLVQSGFYMAVSNAGSYREANIVRIYFNLTTEGAVAVMNSLTAELNAIPIPFNFKALYNPQDYGRYDSAVLYFDKNKYEIFRAVLERVYTQNQSHFQPEVPLFTKFLAPGLALAEEPDQKFGEQESFGMNRCQIVANAILETWHQGDNSPESRMTSIQQQFSLLNIELQRPYLNASSEDIYTPLNL
ncbi:T3SS effector HopA1 family protein [Brasilonema sp. UFV-L1]|uniref:T3SS effector HopA1 family protein n=1 Tax=Brasilonema sp. UFV-L1 TaxID=2234130 RepID=UPI00145DDE98|nr:T3SS effector HopA1 family protein [Brasilonema sp. UFV-L1]NMG08708.1 hypothetical protein [Brasilonema sp. UFV-L1]